MEIAKHRIPTGALVEIVETGVRLYVMQRYYDMTHERKNDNKPEPRYALTVAPGTVLDDLSHHDCMTPIHGGMYIKGYRDDELMIIERNDTEDTPKVEGYTGGIITHNPKTSWLAKHYGENHNAAGMVVDMLINADDSVCNVLGTSSMVRPFAGHYDLAKPHWKGKRLIQLFYDRHGYLERILEVPDVRELWKDPA
jgi:hypothetical protein